MFISAFGDDSAFGRAGQEADLQEIGFIDIFNRFYFFRSGGGNGGKSDRSALEFFNNSFQNMAVGWFQPGRVDIQHSQSFFGDSAVHAFFVFNLREIADSFQKTIGDAGSFSGAGRNFLKACFVGFYAENPAGTFQDFFNIRVVVKFQAICCAEAVAKRIGKRTQFGGGADQGEFRQIQLDGASGRAFADNNV